jgi:hypothetical protein
VSSALDRADRQALDDVLLQQHVVISTGTTPARRKQPSAVIHARLRTDLVDQERNRLLLRVAQEKRLGNRSLYDQRKEKIATVANEGLATGMMILK